jgi:hypothetical protein
MTALWLLLLAQAQAPAPAEPVTPTAALMARTTAQERVDELLEDGRHVRLGTETKGPIHLWWPKNYRAATAVTVVYIHGYFIEADQAWLEHKLVTQFRDSGKNALFIVPTSPSSWKDELTWPDLDALLSAVKEQGKVEMPHGPVTVVGHSGAYRTVQKWLSEAIVDRVVLIDGLYAFDKDFEAWFQDKNHHLILVGFETTQRTEWLIKKVPSAVRLDEAPWAYDLPPPAFKNARVAFIDAQRFDHFALITSGRVIPWVLRHSLP